jgi:hypothetical protein
MAIENLKKHLTIAVLIFSMVGFFNIYSQPQKQKKRLVPTRYLPVLV